MSVQVKFYKVLEVDMVKARARLKLWLRISWVDQRLPWKPEDIGGERSLVHFPDDIWVPDIVPYNAFTGIDQTLETARMLTSSDGSIFWSRPGVLDVSCRFSGLVAFPFDHLRFEVEFGGWSMGAGHQGIDCLPVDATNWRQLRPRRNLPGNSHQERPGEAGPLRICVVPLTLTGHNLHRRAGPLIDVLRLAPPARLCSSPCFRSLSSGPTPATLNSFFQHHGACGCGPDAVGPSLVPTRVRRDLWIDLFLVIHTLFCCIAPGVDAHPRSRARKASISFQHGSSKSGNTCSTRSRRPMMRPLQRPSPFICAGSRPASLKAASILVRWRVGQGGLARSSAGRSFPALLPDGAGHTSTGPSSGPDLTDETNVQRLLWFQQTFYALDTNKSGKLEPNMGKTFFSFAAPDMSPEDRTRAYDRAARGSGGLNDLEFCELCVKELWSVSMDTLKLALENTLKVHDLEKALNKAYWTKWGQKIESLCQRWVPVAYLSTVCFLFAMTNVDDTYMVPDYLRQRHLCRHLRQLCRQVRRQTHLHSRNPKHRRRDWRTKLSTRRT